MAINGQGIKFYPIFWAHHDCWQYYDPIIPSGRTNHFHYGHAHLWMMGFPWGTAGQSQDAFSGFQDFNFSVEDIWGPRSGDDNQMTPYKVIGTPKWYFHVTELWRRAYIQPWELQNGHVGSGVVGREGIKWDAATNDKIFYGPFREGIDSQNHQAYTPLYLPGGGRTLPLEYFQDETRNRAKRDNYVKIKAQAALGSNYVDAKFNLDHGTNIQSFATGGEPAGVGTFPDGFYIGPILEYQRVTQLNWERPPGWAAEHDVDDTNFGDGWSVHLTVPFVDPTTGQYRSPFGSSTGVVSPIGVYHNNLVADANKLRYRQYDGGYDASWLAAGLQAGESGGLVTFRDPYGRGDGMFVQQCIGGIIQAKAVVTIESTFGGRQDIDVTATNYAPLTPFAGSDQLLPASS